MLNLAQSLSTQVIEELGWDDGFGENKIYAKTGEKKYDGIVEEVYEKVSFPSYDCEIPKDSVLETENKSLEKGFSLNRMIIEYKEKRYAVGRYAVTQKPKESNQSFSKDKFREETEIIKLLVGLAYLYTEADHLIINDLIVGLSLESFKEYRMEIEHLYKNKCYEFSVLTTSGIIRPMTVHVNNVTCKCQGVGAFWDKFFIMDQYGRVKPGPESTRLKKRRFGIVDCGSRTVDAFISDGLDLVYGSEEVFDGGIKKVYNMVSEQLNNCPEMKIEKMYMDWINPITRDISDELFWQGKYYSITIVVDLCEKAFTTVGKRIAKTMKERWAGELDVLELIILCGGGAKSKQFHEAFKQEFRTKVEVADDPQFANTKGYVKSKKFDRIAQQLLKNRM